MKKIVLFLAALSLGTASNAQKSKIYTAKEYMRNGDMPRAIKAIDEAVENEKTSTDGDAWFTRGEVYEKLAETDATATNAIEESTKSYLKVLAVKPNFEKNEIDPKLMRIAYKAYNAGVSAYSGDASKGLEPNYDASFKAFQQVVDVREVNNGKHFESNKKFDTIAAQAMKYQALSAYYANNFDVALPILLKVKNNLAARDPYVYTSIISIYEQKNDNAGTEKILEEAKKAYPKNEQIAGQEINYYARVGKTNELIAKMEEAVKADPNNSLLHYNLGALYSNMANPRDENNALKEKPANSKELEAKAVMAYKYAIDGNPNVADYQFNLGALYFNNAADMTSKMKALGTSDADNRKYDELKKLRTQEFVKSLPYIQKAYDLLTAKKASGQLNSEENKTYRGALTALSAIYDDLGQKEKSIEMSNKLKEN